MSDNAVEKIEVQPEEVAEEKVEAVVRELPVDDRKFENTHSEELGEIFGALAKAQGEMRNGAKDTDGYGYKYMELGQLTDISRKPLSDNGLCVIQTHELVIRVKNPAVVTHTTIGHSSGQWHKSSLEIPMTLMKQLNKAQIFGVTATYGRRYALQAICNIASEEDTDGIAKS